MKARYLRPEELTFRLDHWVETNCTVVSAVGAEWVLLCPHCGREKLAVNVRTKRWQCFTCDFRGDQPTWFVAGVLGTTLAVAERVIVDFTEGQTYGPVGDLDSYDLPVRPDADLPAGAFPPLAPLGPDQLAYCARRKFDPSHLAAFGVMTASNSGRGSRSDRLLTGRLVVPIWNSRGVAVGWAARAITDAKQKVLNSPRSCREPSHAPGCTCAHREWGLPEVPNAAASSEMVLGSHLLRAGELAILVEGVTDALACGPGFVSPLGAKLSVQQALILARSRVREAVILFDPDDRGQVGRRKALDLLSQYLPVRVARCPPGTDPGDLGRARALECVAAAASISQIEELGDAPAAVSISEIRAPKPIIAGL